MIVSRQELQRWNFSNPPLLSWPQTWGRATALNDRRLALELRIFALTRPAMEKHIFERVEEKNLSTRVYQPVDRERLSSIADQWPNAWDCQGGETAGSISSRERHYQASALKWLDSRIWSEMGARPCAKPSDPGGRHGRSPLERRSGWEGANQVLSLVACFTVIGGYAVPTQTLDESPWQPLCGALRTSALTRVLTIGAIFFYWCYLRAAFATVWWWRSPCLPRLFSWGWASERLAQIRPLASWLFGGGFTAICATKVQTLVVGTYPFSTGCWLTVFMLFSTHGGPMLWWMAQHNGPALSTACFYLYFM